MATQQLKTLANRLYEAGLAVIPTGENKRAITAQWQTLVGENRIAPNGNFDKTARGVGVITGHTVTGGYLLALDVDCYDKDVSSHMAEYIADLVGKPMPYRVGQRPKFLVPVICDETTRKITSRAYTDCFAPEDQAPSKLEVLGLGQQFVAYGEHPSAVGGQYKWYNGEFELDALPKVTLTQIRQIIAEFEAKAEEGGLEPVKSALKSTEQPPVDNPFVGLIKSDVSLAEAAEIISHIDPDMPYDDWKNVGMGLHHEFDGSDEARDLWVEWSNTGKTSEGNAGTQYDPVKKWNEDFNREGGAVLTFRTVCAYAREAGADLSAIARKHKAKQSLDFEALNEVEPMAEPSAFAKPVTPFAQRQKHTQRWLITGHLERKRLAAIFSPPKQGKSFIALDMGLSIAFGIDWAGCAVSQGAVLYIAGEGREGVDRRIAGWQIQHGLTDQGAPMYVTERNVLLPKKEQLEEMLAFIKSMPEPPKAIFIDTYARATAGLKENDTGETGEIVGILDALRESNDATIIAVHHTSKANPEDLRGNSALAGALDSAFMIKKKDNVVSFIPKLQKDTSTDKELHFNLTTVDLPLDLFEVEGQSGLAVQTAVAEYDPTISSESLEENEDQRFKGLRDNAKLLWRKIRDTRNAGHTAPITQDMSIKYGLDIEGEAVDAAMVEQAFEDSYTGAKYKRAYDAAVERLASNGIAEHHQGRFVIITKGANEAADTN